MSKKSNQKSLITVPPEMCFWVNCGPVLKDLKELCEVLKAMSQETFAYHVNNEKNDFARWVKEAIKDEHLSLKLAPCKTPVSMWKVIKACLPN